jgi:Arc/MetJ-type ribon-helix-helix transcriptional regulator
MREVIIHIPDDIAGEADAALAEGRFKDLDELLQTALKGYLADRASKQIEQDQLADLEWARSQTTH